MTMNINYKNIEFYFYPRKTATNYSGKCSIYCAIRENKEVVTAPFSTNIKVSAENWNKRLKTTDDDFKDIVSAEINQVENVLRQIKFNLQMTEKNVSAQLIKDTFLAMTKTKKGSSKSINKIFTLVEMVHQYIQKSESLGASTRTILNIASIKNNIIKYLNQLNKINLKPSDIDLEFIDKYSIWMQKEKKFSTSHANRHISFIRRILDFSILKKQITHNAIQSLQLRASIKLDPVGLSSNEIKLLEGTNNFTPLEQKSVDIFLFMCGCGIDHIDYNNLSDQNLRQIQSTLLLKYERMKTKTYLNTKVCEANPILKHCALNILEKYGNIENLPKISTTQVINKNLQSVARKIGIKTHLTTKRARKTYANVCINEENNSDEQTAYQLGHVKTDKLKHYRRYNDNILNNLIR